MKVRPVDEVVLDLRSWREAVLNDLLATLVLGAAPVIVMVLIEAKRHPEQKLAALAFLLIYLVVAGLMALRRLDFHWRAWPLLLLGHGVAALAMARGGLAGDGRMFLVVLPAIASILLGTRAALISVGIGLLTYAVAAGLARAGVLFYWLVRLDNPLGANEWLFAGITFSFSLAVLLTLQWEFNRFQARTTRRQAELLEMAQTLQARYQIVSELVSDFAYALRVESDGSLIPEWSTGTLTRIEIFEIGKPLSQETVERFLHPDDLLSFRQAVQEVLSGRSYTVEFRIFAPDGKMHWLRNYARPEWSEEEGRVVRIYGAAQDITARKEAEQALEQSERRFRAFSEANLAGVYVMQDGVVRYINPALCQMLGYEQEEVVDRLGIDELIHPDDRERIRKQYRLRLGKEPVGSRYTLKALRKDGSTIYCEVLAQQITYEGRPAILGTVLDVTEQVQARERLERQVAQLALLREIGGQIASVAALDTVLERAVHLIAETFGYEHVAVAMVDEKRGEVVMRARAGSYRDLFPPDHRLPITVGMVGWVVRNGRTRLANNVEEDPYYVNRFPDRIPTRSELTVPIRVGGKVVGVLDVQSMHLNAFSAGDVLVLETVADQIAVAIENARLYEALQEELAAKEQALEALRESETSAQAILNALDASVVLVSGDGSILATNPAARKALAEAGEQIIGRHYAEVLGRRIHNRPDHFKEVLCTGRGVRFEREVDGRVYVHSIHPVLDDRGKVSRAVILVTDATERVELQRQVARAERMAALGRLAAGLAHEINNPLQAIRSHLELVLDFPLEPRERREHLLIIQDEIERLANITQRVLSFARPTDDQREIVSVAELVQRVLTLTSKQLERNRIQVHLDLPADLPPLRVTSGQIVQVLLNLFINAIEAMPDGGRLELAARAERDTMTLTLTNDGPPIPDEYIERVFDPFFTTKSGSTGMGLAVSYGIIQRHGGTIRVENVKEGGVRFTITLPVVGKGDHQEVSR